MPDLLSLALLLPPGLTAEAALHFARLAGRLDYVAVHISLEDALDQGFVTELRAAAAPAAVVVATDGTAGGIVHANDPVQVAAERRAMDQDGVTRPLLVAVPVSIGRTMNEAVARADREPRFTGDRHPQVSGIFGAFEQAQEQVLALARAGADGLIADVPVDLDVADVLAQVKALVVGATPALLERSGTTASA
jgi:hypothetical protein